MTTPQHRLASLGITLPVPAKPVANYVGWVKSGSMIYVAGQLPLLDNVLQHTGLVGSEVSAEQANACARLCAINLLAQVADACNGDLSRVKRVVKLLGFVAVSPGFTKIPVVVNGASDLMVDVFGDAGRHARSSVGVAALPMNACVEVEGVFEIVMD